MDISTMTQNEFELLQRIEELEKFRESVTSGMVCFGLAILCTMGLVIFCSYYQEKALKEHISKFHKGKE